jgi:hypothetical protein
MRRAIPRMAIILFSGFYLLPAARADEPATPQELFERRIMPIFRSPQPSSCVQCHLAGVDLKNYILPSSDKTFLSLRDQGLIDLDRPAQSKILNLIQMGAEDRQAAALIHAMTRKAEYEAFAAWIAACCNDAKLRNAAKLDAATLATPARPVEVIRHARKDRLLESFERTIWAMRMRCMNCHTEGTPQNNKLRQEHGDRVTWVKKAGPEATMEYLLASELIDGKSPEKSLLLLKPLNEVKHGGGKKFQPGDQAYRAYRSWLADVAAIRGDRYAKAADLPPQPTDPLGFATDIWIKLIDTPPAWGDRLLQVDVYAWDAQKRTWEAEPLATTDRPVAAKARLWQHSLTLLAARGSTRAETWQKQPSLPPGRYLVKVYVDTASRLGRDWTAKMGEGDYVGQAEVQARWPAGYGQMTVIGGDKVKK